MSTRDQDKSARAPSPAAGAATPPARPSTPARVPLRPSGPVEDRGAAAGTANPASAAPPVAPAAAKPAETSNDPSLPLPDPPLSLVEDAPLQSDLALEDTAALRKRGVATSADPINGYNPYDTGPGAGARPSREAPPTPPKRTDLRKLSQWIQTQRRVEDLKKDADEGGK